MHIGCGGSVPAPAPQPLPIPERVAPFLVDPLRGFPLEPPVVLEDRVRAAYHAMRAGGPLPDAESEAEALLEIDAGFHPAAVLLAQTLLLDGRSTQAFGRLASAAAELPDYEAAQLVLGFAAESAGELIAAYEAFERLPASLERSERLDRLRPRVVDILSNRFDEAMTRGRFEDAELTLEQLDLWGADHPATTERGWLLAMTLGDEEAERVVLERLLALDPERRDAIERLAELEIAAGELRRGLARLEALALRFADDAELAERVERAKFRWRLETFPDDIRSLASKQELTRAELAALFYWFVPEVRYAPLEDPPVATDILEHALRDEIVRVLNASLMEIESTVHRFTPNAPAIRGDVISALLRLSGLGEAQPVCLVGVDLRRLRPVTDLTCETAYRCALITEMADCLPAARVSGGEALELFRLRLAARSGRASGALDE